MTLPNPGMSFTPFDPLPASDLNDIVENVEALSDGSGLEDDALLNNPTKIDADASGVGFVEIGRAVISSPGDVLSVTIPAKRLLKFQLHIIADGGTVAVRMTFNGDTANNYSHTRTLDGGAIADAQTEPSIAVTPTFATQRFVFGDITNFATQEKLVLGNIISGGNAGASGIVSIGTWGGKWVNTSNQITSITITNTAGGTDYAVGSILKVYGSD